MFPELFKAALSGDIRQLARCISLLEEGAEGALVEHSRLPLRRNQGPGHPEVIGLTGPPGAGKSCLVDCLVQRARLAGKSVAVIAVDPSSPFSGGAILGDRLRMEQHALDSGVYIRSLSARGNLGGLSRATSQVVDLLDAAGWDLVLVETVGVGQSELAVCEVADTAVVVMTPESGDTVQAMKAGLTEIADVFLVNKADRPGADLLCRELELAVSLEEEADWRAPVVATSATENFGIEEAIAAIEAHQEHCRGPGREAWLSRRARGRLRSYLDLVGEEARELAAEALASNPELRERLASGEVHPFQLLRGS